MSIAGYNPFAYGVEIAGPPVIADVTGDGIADAVIMLECQLHEPGVLQVLVLVGNAAGGVTVQSTVLVADPNAPGLAGSPSAVLSASIGSVVVRWTDQQSSAAKSPATQDRTYTNSAGVYKQTGGATAFPDLSSKLSINVATVTLTRDPNTPTYAGTMTISIHNAGPKPTMNADLTLNTPIAAFGLATGAPTGATTINNFTSGANADTETIVYSLPPIAVGATQVVKIPVGIQGLPTSPPTGVTVSAEAPNGIATPVNNTTTVTFTLN